MPTVGEAKSCREVSAPQDVHTTQGASPARVEETRSIDIINVLLNFEIKEVCNFHHFLPSEMNRSWIFLSFLLS